jgi:hypothetical protein
MIRATANRLSGVRFLIASILVFASLDVATGGMPGHPPVGAILAARLARADATLPTLMVTRGGGHRLLPRHPGKGTVRAVKGPLRPF